jgi:hypothetical protein
MNEPLLPLPPDQVDELLSGELDGEFDAAATDAGLTPDDARRRLDATPGVNARRHALTAARDQLAALPELDELIEARLRAKAMKAAAEEHASMSTARSRRRYRALSAVAGIAAAIAIVAGVAVLVNRGGSSAKQSSAGSAVAAPPTSHPAEKGKASDSYAVADFGDAPDAHALAQSAASKMLAPKRVPLYGSASAQSGATSNDRSASGTAPCDDAARNFAGGVDNVVPLRGTARIAGSPVEVYVFPKGGTNVVVVVTPDCKLVIQQVASAPAP